MSPICDDAVECPQMVSVNCYSYEFCNSETLLLRRTIVFNDTYLLQFHEAILTIDLRAQFYTANSLDNTERVCPHARHPYESSNLFTLFNNMCRIFA